MYVDRIELYKKLEHELNSTLLVYITSDRQGMSGQLADDVVEYFIDHLEKIGAGLKISLYLYTCGGNPLTARNIVNLLRMYCDELNVIVPRKAHSAGTILCLGANEITMTNQATLSPIDPSLTSELNPRVNGKISPVSVEAVNGYLEFAKKKLKIDDEAPLTDIFLKLTELIPPVVLGEVYRSRAQIYMIAAKLLENQHIQTDKMKKTIDFLCSESGNHDYTINRNEAKNDLGLKVKEPTSEQYVLIKKIYDDISDELKLRVPFPLAEPIGAYEARTCLLESVKGGADYYLSNGLVTETTTPDGAQIKGYKVLFEGWHRDPSEDK